jgi:hypothetical protein
MSAHDRHTQASEIHSLAHAPHVLACGGPIEERLASTNEENYGDQGEMARDKLGLAEGHKSSFKKFDPETLIVQNSVDGGGQ